ncbi:hypothetical protein [Legionella cherrii]|uniref:Transposase n=1 Tax=Legionella cherrii TaxID=28084 RepID=A0ABY6T4Y4_9GAMM|nr:hypothetical protein [Legionella cherrii]VEB35545.1 Uncharacterised protein [Legionella cherrii]
MKKESLSKDYESGIEAIKKRYLPKAMDLLKDIESFSPDLADIIVRQGIHEIWQEKNTNT